MLKSVLAISQGIKPAVTPIWFMRQAGRYLPEYRKVREKLQDFIQFVLNSEAAAEVTLQPLARFDLNAAIIFSDILMVPYAMGVDVKFVESIGPVIQPINDIADIDLSLDRQKEVYGKISKSISMVAKELSGDIALIGFSGSPWTVMCYMIEGVISKNFQKVKAFYLSNPKKWDTIVDHLIESTVIYLSAQVEAGAEVIKLFDSWAGAVAHEDFEKLIINPTKTIVDRLKEKYPHVPIIGFPKGCGMMYVDYALKSGVDILAIDQHIPINWAKNNLQNNIVLQGNMDNMLLAYAPDRIKKTVNNIMQGFGNKNFIFNLGHGILPQTKIENILLTIEGIRHHEGDK